MMDPNVDYFLGCLKKSLKDMSCDRVENQIMQIMGFGGNRLFAYKRDIGSLFCNLVSIVLKFVDTNDEGYAELVKSFKRSYISVVREKYQKGMRELESGNNKSFIIVPILALTQEKEAKHMFFAVVTKVSDKYNCILVNKGYRPDYAFTYHECANRSYEELIDIFSGAVLLSVDDIYRKLSGTYIRGVNVMDQKVGNCICKNMEAAINASLCVAYPKYKRYGRIPAGVSNKFELHRMYIDNLKEAIKDIPKFVGFENEIEDKWKEYMYNKKFTKRMNKIRRVYLEEEMCRERILKVFGDKYLRNEMRKINKGADECSGPSMDRWKTYIYNKAFERAMNSFPNDYIADQKEFFEIFLETFKEENIKDRLKYVSAKTLFEWYDNFLMLSVRRVERLSKDLYLVNRRWLDRYDARSIESQEVDNAVHFLKSIEKYFPMAVKEMNLYYSKVYFKMGRLERDNNYNEKSLRLYKKGIKCNPYKMELEEIFENTYNEMLDKDVELEDNEHRFILSKKDSGIYKLLNSDYARGKEKLTDSLNDALKKNKEAIKQAFLTGDDGANYLKISDINLSEIKSDINNMDYNDKNNIMDILSKVSNRDILEWINFGNININELFFRGLKEGNFELTSMLLDRGIDLNIEDPKGNTPLMLACMGGNEDNVKLIFSKSVRFKEKYLGGCNIIRFIDEYGINMDIAKILIDKMTSKEELDRGFEEMDNKPALMYVCRRSNVDLVKLLIDYGVDINKTDKYGNTSLKDICSMSQSFSNIEIVRLLLDNKADVDRENYRNVTALMMACCSGNVEFAKMLLLAGADKDKENKRGMTALDMAIENDDEEMKELIKNGIFNGIVYKPKYHSGVGMER